jgi:hypothetical protein
MPSTSTSSRASHGRKQLAVKRLGVDPAAVEKVVDETDRQRDHYVKTH